MSRTLSGPMTAALAGPLTQPGYLIRFDYPAVASPVLSALSTYHSTLSTISWSGQSWLASDASVSGLSQDGSGSNAARLSLGNTDLAAGALVLVRGASDTPVSIWAVYSLAPAAGDPVQVFSGVVDGAEIGADKVVFNLIAANTATLQAPRVFINKESGFNFIQPEGTKIVWGSETFELKRK